MKVAITGASGFVGGHLVEFLRREAPEVTISGIVRPHGGVVGAATAGLRLIEADLADPLAVRAALAELRPEAIVHLAGQSSPQQSWLDPGGTLRTNVLGIVHLVEGARRLGLSPGPPRRGQRGGVRKRRSPRRALDGRDAPPPELALCGQQGGAGPPGGRVRRSRRHAGGPDADLPPHRPRPRRGLRGELVRAADRRDRGGTAPARDPRRQPRGGPRLHRRARRGACLLGALAARPGRPGLQRLLRPGAAASASFSTSCWASPA